MNQQNGITYRKLPGLSTQGVRIWGLLFLAFGLALNPAVQKSLASDEVDFIFTSVGLIVQLLHFAAIPLFTFLLVEGFTHTADLKAYATRIGILALVAAVPYNFAMFGSLLGDFSLSNLGGFKLNPVFAMLLALVLLYFFRRYSGRTFKRIAIKAVIWIMAFVWVQMLHIEYGIAVVLLVPALYYFRKKRMLMIFVGCIAMTLCGFLDISAEASNYVRTASYIASAPVAFLILHFYNGEPGEGNRYVNYLAYPVLLVLIGLVGKFAI